MSAEAKAQTDELLQWAAFHLGDEIYGVNVMQVQEVLRYTEITPVPGAPLFVLGIINLRGNVVTVIDTRNRFSLGPHEVTDNTRIVIVESVGQVVGLLVDRVAEVIDIYQSEIEKTPNVGNEESTKYIAGVCNKNDLLHILIDLDTFVESAMPNDAMVI